MPREGIQKYDWFGELKVSDADKTLVHKWPVDCSAVPPGRLIRTLKVDQCGVGHADPKHHKEEEVAVQ